MRELLARLIASPGVALGLAVSSLFANVLALASSLFVMQVLNRYVAHGVHSTLTTLVTGVLIAIALEFVFRQARMRIARGISVYPDEYTAFKGFSILTAAKAGEMDKIPPEKRREILNGMQAVESAYNASNIATILDVPFSILFVGVLYLLQPVIALVVAGFLVTVFLVGALGARSMREKSQQLQEASGEAGTLMSTVTRETDTVRAFNAGAFLRRAWLENLKKVHQTRRDITARQGSIQAVTQSMNALMTVAVIALGAMLVVAGQMDVGVMIGANILASRALQPISKFSQMGGTMVKAKEALAMFKKLESMPLEATEGAHVASYTGSIEFRDFAFAFEGSNSPLFESLDLKVNPGGVLIVTGGNGTGKTTFARLLVGLLSPSRGQILVDGVDLQQIEQSAWRRQILYLPQQPALINATLVENLTINNPDATPEAVDRVIDAAGLRRFVDESEDGLATVIVDNGWRLSEGIRRRIALARALLTEARLAIIDEPTESLDADGCAKIMAVLADLAKRGRTIIIMSHNANVVKGAHTVLDLSHKPHPKVTQVAANETREVADGSSTGPDGTGGVPSANGNPEAPKAGALTEEVP